MTWKLSADARRVGELISYQNDGNYSSAIVARARELGGSVFAEPQNAPWVRFAVLADPAGASFIASQFVAENR